MIPRLLGATTVALALVGAFQAGYPGDAATPPTSIHRDIDGAGTAPRSTTGRSVPPGLFGLPATQQPSPTVAATVAATPAPSGPRYVVVMVLDGARPDYLTVPGIPHVRALMQRGTVYTNAFAGVLQSDTPAGHAAIGTGMNPKANGILGFGWEDEADRWVSVFSPDLIQAHVMEKLMSHAPSLAGRLHRQNPALKVAALGSYKYYANDALGGPDADYTLYYASRKDGKFAPVAVAGHAPPAKLLQRPDVVAPTSKHLPLGETDRLAMQLAADTFTDTGAQVIMLNIPEFDQPLGHIYAANRDQKDVRALMQGFDRDLGMLEKTYRRAGVLDQTVFVITADHGFQAFDHIVPPEEIERAITPTGLKITHGTYDSADYLWVNHPGRANEAAAAVARMANPHIQSVYFKEATAAGVQYIRASGANLFAVPGVEEGNQLLLNSFAGPNSPDVVVLFREGTVGVWPGTPWKGDHGGADWESQHVPLIIAGAGIRSNTVSSYPARLIDLAPTILALLGADYHGLDGIPLADALSRPPVGAVQSQATLGSTLSRSVAALSAQAATERAEDRNR